MEDVSRRRRAIVSRKDPRNPTQALICALERDPGGVVIVWYSEPYLREWLIAEVDGLALPEEIRPLRVASVDEALQAFDRMALLALPGESEERSAVEQLEGCLDALLLAPRTFPVVLFLLRQGDGRDALARAPGLSSWTRGCDIDPDQLAQIDVVADRARFASETGQSVDDWLADWRAGRISRTGKSFGLAYWAALLEPPEVSEGP